MADCGSDFGRTLCVVGHIPVNFLFHRHIWDDRDNGSSIERGEEEGGIPMAVTGTAAGVISVIAYTPDIFMPLIGGVLLDRFPGQQGYKLFFFMVAGICAVGLLATQALCRNSEGVKTTGNEIRRILACGNGRYRIALRVSLSRKAARRNVRGNS